MVNFLTFTCIKPQRKFAGILPIRTAMFVPALCISACAYYSYEEAKIFFNDLSFLFGVVNNKIIFFAQLIIAALVLLCYLLRTKGMAKFNYSMTFGLAGWTFALNIYKKTIFIEKYKEEDAELLRWLFLIRISSEFVIELYSCYLVYCLTQLPR